MNAKSKNKISKINLKIIKIIENKGIKKSRNLESLKRFRKDKYLK